MCIKISEVKCESSATEREWIAMEIEQVRRGIIEYPEAADIIIRRIKEKLILRLYDEIKGAYEDKANDRTDDIEDVVMATETAIEIISSGAIEDDKN